MPPRPNSPRISYLPALMAVTISNSQGMKRKTAYCASSRRSSRGSMPPLKTCFALATGGATETKVGPQCRGPVAGGAHLALRAGVCGRARVPQWEVNGEAPYGADDLDSQAQRREKGRGGWNGVRLPASVPGVNAKRQAHEGKGLEPSGECQLEGWHDAPSAVLRLV